MKINSFASEVKNELTSNEYSIKEEKIAILSAYIRINGILVFRNKKSYLTLTSENAKIAKFIYSLLKDLYPYNVSIDYKNNYNRKKRISYVISINDGVDELLHELGVDYLEGKISKSIVFDDTTIIGYLIGAFLASGSVNSPETSNYHLEIALNDDNLAKWLTHLFIRYKAANITPKIAKRRNKTIVYIKKGDQIGDFLALIGASGCVLEFENVRINRDFINNHNRLTNLDTANMSKTIEAGQRQKEEITFLIKKHGKDYFKKAKVALVVKYRLEFESMSLEEIASKVSEELNENITKSNINHIFRMIHERYIKEK